MKIERNLVASTKNHTVPFDSALDKIAIEVNNIFINGESTVNNREAVGAGLCFE